MFDAQSLYVYVAAVVVLMITPGVDMVYVVSNGISYGKKGGLYSALGVGIGGLMLTLISAFGVSALVALFPGSLLLIQYAGACYLLWLAYRIWKSPISAYSLENTTTKKELLLRGILVNILNPKALIFFMAFIPQFVNEELGNTSYQIIFLGLLLTVLGTIINSLYGLFSGTIGNSLLKNDKYLRYQKYLLCIIFVGLAIRLFF
ncbi:LysE family translocator [Candidatus Spongiihabitans sp.]|uniref:LysE family translocator n=1 Tax=Candidatus Spongiihabitans sp. TaxID=3101308 RepID=UPI003C6F0B34